jgi:peptide deformylase
LPVLTIVNYPDERLEQVCRPVKKFDRALAELIKNMRETMIAADGVGLAAPQVGITERLAIVDVDDENGLIELINPKLLATNGKQTGLEGCLSFPGLYGDVTRHDYVKVRAQDRRGKWHVIEAEDFLARAIQHEMDHLDGILFTSKVIQYIDEKDLEEEEAH